MYTVYRDDLDLLARRTVQEHRDHASGALHGTELEALRADRLRRTIAHVRAGSPFYADRLAHLDGAAVDALDLTGLATLPFTTKDDLRAALHDVLSRPVSRAWVYYETTGTTGRSTPCPRGEVDSLANNVALVEGYRDVFDAHGDQHVVAVMGPTELHSTGDTFGDVLRCLGHTVVKMWPHSPAVGYRRALHLLGELGVTAMVCTPGTAAGLLRAAREEGVDPRRDLGVRLALALGELATPAFLRTQSHNWGTTFYNCMYASQEASVLARGQADGLLHTVPLNNVYEVVDPQTGQPVPPEGPEGVRQGELVVTALYQGVKPLVRYRTGDMVRLRPDTTGPDAVDLLEPIGRVRDALELGGRWTCAYDLEQCLFEDLPGCLDYRLVLDREDGEDLLTVHLEPVVPDDADRLREASVAATGRLADRFGVRVRVDLGDTGAITGTSAMVSWKAARLHDRRHGVDEPERLAALALAEARDASRRPAAAGRPVQPAGAR